MEKFRFLNWEVYKMSRSLFKDVLKIIEELPGNHKFGIGNQLSRSTSSIALNIAEGSGKSSAKDLNRYLDIALGSAYETLASLDLLREIGLLSGAEFEKLLTSINSIANQLGGFKKKLKASLSTS